MGLAVYTAPAVEPITLDEIKAHCRVTHADDDVYLIGLVAACREYAETLTRRSFVSTTWRLTLDDWPSVREGNFGSTLDAIILPRSPVASVTSITYIDMAEATQTLATSVYELSNTTEPATIRLKYGQSWPSVLGHPECITITFVAGYGAYDEVPEIAKAATARRVRVVALSVVYPLGCELVAGEITKLRQLLPESVSIIVGGRASLFGAIYGTLLVCSGKSLFSESFPQLWLFCMGGLFIAVVVLFAGAFADSVASSADDPIFAGNGRIGSGSAAVAAEEHDNGARIEHDVNVINVVVVVVCSERGTNRNCFVLGDVADRIENNNHVVAVAVVVVVGVVSDRANCTSSSRHHRRRRCRRCCISRRPSPK